MTAHKDIVWVERYRPRTLDECILPERLKDELRSFIGKGSIPHMLFTGSQGNGKTSTARAICEDLGADYIFINGSEESGIDTLRGKIKSFASTVSLSSEAQHKVIIIDEADYLNQTSTQPALRGLMEEFHENCRFILTCNYKNRILKALHSRCAVVEFEVTSKEKAAMMGEFFKRLIFILEENGITYDKKVVAEFIKTHFPDMRSIINSMQRYGQSGTIDDGILTSVSDEITSTVLKYVKDKDFGSMRRWVDSSPTVDLPVLFDKLLDVLEPRLQKESIPELILLLDDYQDKATRSVNPRITLSACLTQMMMILEFK